MTEQAYQFHLYLVGQPGAGELGMIENLQKSLKRTFGTTYTLELRDIFDVQHAQQAVKDQVFSVPSLVRANPAPVRMAIGSLEDAAELVLKLQ